MFSLRHKAQDLLKEKETSHVLLLNERTKNGLKKIVYLINLLLKHSCQKTHPAPGLLPRRRETLKSRANTVVHRSASLFNTTSVVNGCFIASFSQRRKGKRMALQGKQDSPTRRNRRKVIETMSHSSLRRPIYIPCIQLFSFKRPRLKRFLLLLFEGFFVLFL